VNATSDSGSTPPSKVDGDEGPRRTVGQVLKDIALFFAAPFITMAYMPLFPFIGFSMLRQELRRRKEAG